MTDTIETGTEKRGRGGPRGPRGPRQWSEEPTLREQVMGESLAKAIKAETGKDIDTETIRTIRFVLPKWLKSDEFQEKKKNIKTELKRAKALERKRKAQKMLEEAQAELDNDDFDDEDDFDEDEDDSDEDSDEDEDFDDDDEDDDDEVDFTESV